MENYKLNKTFATKFFTMKKVIFTIATLLFCVQNIIAQSGSGDFMRETGKIYVVVTVIIAMFIGIIIYLISLDRKLTKLEDQIKNE